MIATQLGVVAKVEPVNFHSSRPGHDLSTRSMAAQSNVPAGNRPWTPDGPIKHTIDMLALRMAW